VKGRGYFCPTLDIIQIDKHLQIGPDVEGLNAFRTACLEN
jgi:hypothetical protein